MEMHSCSFQYATIEKHNNRNIKIRIGIVAGMSLRNRNIFFPTRKRQIDEREVCRGVVFVTNEAPLRLMTNDL